LFWYDKRIKARLFLLDNMKNRKRKRKEDKKMSEKYRKKVKVAVIFGGYSSEYSVSLESSSAVIKNLDPEKYEVLPVGITKEGEWFSYTGPVENIENDTWQQSEYCTPAMISPDRNTHGLVLLGEDGAKTMPIDVAFPVMHGKNGEDGTIQGLITMAGIPLAGCGILASALCMDKDRAHLVAEAAGVRVPKAMVLTQGDDRKMAVDFALKTGYPVYVKPVKAGSSYGVTKVEKPVELQSAIIKAFQYDDEVIMEENIDGFEVGCAVLGNRNLITGEVDEIQLSGGFFDFTEKYTLKTSEIHVPARIELRKMQEIKQTAKTIYQALGCRGFARVDMFLTPDGEIVFNEVNTIPGFTEHSRYPGMMKAAGLEFPEILERIIRLAME
jgi:D-alanine---D-serine ligase